MSYDTLQMPTIFQSEEQLVAAFEMIRRESGLRLVAESAARSDGFANHMLATLPEPFQLEV